MRRIDIIAEILLEALQRAKALEAEERRQRKSAQPKRKKKRAA